jgi:hypothetical protein
MAHGGPTWQLTREERRELARGRHVMSHQSSNVQQSTACCSYIGQMHADRRCRVCLAPLSNGAIVCSEACDDLAWELCPTTDGELWKGNGRSRGTRPSGAPCLCQSAGGSASYSASSLA